MDTARSRCIVVDERHSARAAIVLDREVEPMARPPCMQHLWVGSGLGSKLVSDLELDEGYG